MTKKESCRVGVSGGEKQKKKKRCLRCRCVSARLWNRASRARSCLCLVVSVVVVAVVGVVLVVVGVLFWVLRIGFSMRDVRGAHLLATYPKRIQ